MRYQFVTAAEFIRREQVKSPRVSMADELAEIADLLRGRAPLESVAWRLADLSADFVAKVESAGLRGVQGVHSYSGKGGKLLRKVSHD